MKSYLTDKHKKSELEYFIMNRLRTVRIDDAYAIGTGVRVVGVDIQTMYEENINNAVGFDVRYGYKTYADFEKTRVVDSYYTKTLVLSEDLVVRAHGGFGDDMLTDRDRAEIKLYNDVLDQFKIEYKNV
jgi:hypothetical protein